MEIIIGKIIDTKYINIVIYNAVAYPELVSRGVSERRTSKWLVSVGASNGVTPLIKRKSWPGGGGVSGQPENPPGYATATRLLCEVSYVFFLRTFF